jgi:hypothetical protein
MYIALMLIQKKHSIVVTMINQTQKVRKIMSEYKRCDYCHCDKEGYVKSIDKRGHVFVDATIHEGNIIVNFNGLSKKYPIKYCPMCGRKF